VVLRGARELGGVPAGRGQRAPHDNERQEPYDDDDDGVDGDDLVSHGSAPPLSGQRRYHPARTPGNKARVPIPLTPNLRQSPGETGGRLRRTEPPARPPVLLVDDTRFDAHTPLAYHPERPERLLAARAAAARTAESGIRWDPVRAREASDDEIARVHRE